MYSEFSIDLRLNINCIFMSIHFYSIVSIGNYGVLFVYEPLLIVRFSKLSVLLFYA